MSDNFFQKKSSSKCDKCKVKPTEIDVKLKSSLLHKQGNGDVLILVDMVEFEMMLKYFINFLNKIGITDFQIYTTCLCRTKDFNLPSPIYSVYNYCDCLDLSKLNYKVIVCLGRSLYYLIQGDDFISYIDFSEFVFNPTYFIYENKRVYPIPFLSEWINKDSLENKFVMKQFNFLKEYLKNYSSLIIKPYNIIKIDEPNDFLTEYKDIECNMAWDTETSSLNHFDNHFKVGCLTLTFDGNTGYYLPFEKINRRLLSQFFKTKYQITANGKYDVKAMLVSGVQNSRVDEDITILAHLLNTVRIKNGLKTLAWMIGFGGYDSDLDKYRKQYKCDNFLDIPEHILMNYAVMDSIVTYRVYQWLMNDLVPKQQDVVYDTYKKYIIPVIKVFTKAEMRGLDIDVEYLNNLNNEVKNEIEECKNKILKKLNMNIDINSLKQLGEALEKFSLPSVEKTKAGGYKTGEEQLLYWKRCGYDIADDLLKYRELVKLKTTYIGSYEKNKEKTPDIFFKKQIEEKEDGIAKYIRNGKIHSTFNPARTDTWRSNSDAPNLQANPKHGEAGKRTRPIFKCPDDYYICEADQSGFQLRIAAIMSGDTVMEDIFLNKGGDMHSITAQSVFARDKTLEYFLEHKGEEPYKSFRFKSKGVNFGFLFLRSAFGFKPDLENTWTIQEIEDYIKNNNLTLTTDKNGYEDKYLTVATDIRNKYFLTYPMLEPWGRNCINEAKKFGYTDCMLGGRRHLPMMLFNTTDNQNIREKSHFESVAVNSRVQTFEAIILYKAMVQINNEIEKHNLKSIIIGMIHDSILMYIYKSEVKLMYNIIKEAMDDYNTFGIPLISELELGQIWGFGKEVTDKNLIEFI